MSHYVHHVPGRLRVKTGQLKRSESEAARIRGLLDSTPGVSSCEVNTVTGSIVIGYDVRVTGADRLVALLKDRGHLAATAVAGPGRAARPPAVSVGGTLELAGKTLLGFAVEKAVERSAAALIGALL